MTPGGSNPGFGLSGSACQPERYSSEKALTDSRGLPGPERAQKKARGPLVKAENLEIPVLGASGQVIPRVPFQPP